MSSETLYAARKGGRSTGTLHRDRNCRYLKRLPDEDVISGEPHAFYPDQKRCSYCFGDLAKLVQGGDSDA